MANLSPQQEAINAEHIRHQTKDYVRFDPKCPECKRSEMKAKLDEEKRWQEYKRLNGML